jgi:hypothetical protein
LEIYLEFSGLVRSSFWPIFGPTATTTVVNQLVMVVLLVAARLQLVKTINVYTKYIFFYSILHTSSWAREGVPTEKKPEKHPLSCSGRKGGWCCHRRRSLHSSMYSTGIHPESGWIPWILGRFHGV